ncbi:MAG: polyprenyl synthetase family protein [Planctomycetaceae bacterium]
MSIAPLQPHDSELGPSQPGVRANSAVREQLERPEDEAAGHNHGRWMYTNPLKVIPENQEIRDRLKLAAEDYVIPLEKRHPFTKHQLEYHGRCLLNLLELPEKYLGFTMVMIGNAFWKQSFLSIPFSRRLLLLPGRSKQGSARAAGFNDDRRVDAELDYNVTRLTHQLALFKSRAEQLGYQVLEADRAPAILNILVEGSVDAILGIAGLNDLEKSVDQVLLAGVPSYAIPMQRDERGHCILDESWVWSVLDQHLPSSAQSTISYLPLIRAANALFTTDFPALLPRIRTQTLAQARSPLGQTEDLAYDWLMNGGKRFRPFITLAAYDALTGGYGNTIQPGEPQLSFSPAVCRSAMAIEAFHKASLVHDDIEDDDLYRYGRETLHRTHGVGMAINVGDYLIGLGYQLVNSTRQEFGSDVSGDILSKMALAHIKLCDGQGAEMAWQATPTAEFTPAEALQIYALKTAPAFEAALFAGVRMAGPVEEYEDVISTYCCHLGIGFQILNDLKDWAGDHNNKLVAGQDAKSLRPTLLLALALQTANPVQRRELVELIEHPHADGVALQERPERFRRLFLECGVFEKSRGMVDEFRLQATALADEIKPIEFRDFLNFLVDTVLAEEPTSKSQSLELPVNGHAPV